MIPQKSGMVIVGAVILMVVLSVGCLGSSGQNPNAGNAPVPGQTTVTEQTPNVNNASIHSLTSSVPGQNLPVKPTPTVDIGPVNYSALVVPGQNMTINETWNDATIYAKLDSNLTLELGDYSLLGDQWIINASPGLQITDEGMTYYWYALNGTLIDVTDVPSSVVNGGYTGHGVDRWNVTMTNTGIQTINATLQRYIQPEPRILETHNWTVVVS